MFRFNILGLVKLSLLISMILFNSCKESNPVVIPTGEEETRAIIKYFEDKDGGYFNNHLYSVLYASDIRTQILDDPNKIFIIDIRSAEDFSKGHIKGAANVKFTNLLNFFIQGNLYTYPKVAIVCENGQQSSYAAGLFKAYGVDNVFSMMWGMEAWNSYFDYWTKNISNSKANLFTQEPSPRLQYYPVPKISKNVGSDLQNIQERVKEVFQKDYNEVSISVDNLISNLNSYYIIHFSTNEQYMDPGHLRSSINYIPMADLKLSTELRALPPEKQIAIYCSTGQASAYITAYLQVLGYNVKIVQYGSQAMIYDELKETKIPHWNILECKEYPYEK